MYLFLLFGDELDSGHHVVSLQVSKMEGTP
jgi:hypothetical protein